MIRVGILEVWKRNVLVDASSRVEAIETILADEVPTRQESLTFLRILNPAEWLSESTEPEEILVEALGIVGSLCAALYLDDEAKSDAVERAKAWEDRFLAFAQEANGQEKESTEEGDAEDRDRSLVGRDSEPPPMPGIWDTA
jgi:hypothetical protein